MKYERYELLKKSKDESEFNFVSKGPKGEIEIAVRFDSTKDPNVVNLAFGNLHTDGHIDDITKNGNLDRNKILATVAAAVGEFTAAHPEKYVVFKGSTPSRTRLYRMAISANWEELSSLYSIYGLQLKSFGYCLEDFKKNWPFAGYAVRRKYLNLYL